MIESISDFYERIGRNDLAGQEYSKDKPYFNIHPSQCHIGQTSFSYRDFYKVALVLETGKLYYADKWIVVDRPALMFSTPMIPYAWEATGNKNGSGCYCIFNEAFVSQEERTEILAHTPLFDTSKERIYFLDESSLKNMQDLFSKIKMEMQSDYIQKLDALRCYLHILIHEAMQMKTTHTYTSHKNAAQRIVELFLMLLDRQFPIEIPQKPLQLKSAADYAKRLSIHVNHLNRVVKLTTGCTTSELINKRLIQESTDMLKHSSYSISEIARALGFEEISSFSKYIKKHTGSSPTEIRETHSK